MLFTATTSVPLAGATKTANNASRCGVEPHVRTAVRMAVRTMRLRPVLGAYAGAALNVNQVGHQLKMAVSNTARRLAQVVPFEALGRFTHQNVVSLYRLTRLSISEGHASVTVAVLAAGPEPAIAELRSIRGDGAILIDSRPENGKAFLRGIFGGHLDLIRQGVGQPGVSAPRLLSILPAGSFLAMAEVPLSR